MRTQFGGMKIAALVLILAFVCGIAPAFVASLVRARD